MEADHFDALTRSLTPGRSRRGALAMVLAGAIGLRGWVAVEDAGARKRKKKKKKRRASCRDGKQNGGETDVDCGGPCPRCGDGKRCASGGDCESGFCTGTCQRCSTSPNNCNPDAVGPCFCRSEPGGDVCVRSAILADSCEECPAGTAFCEPVGIASGFQCFSLCGAA